LQFDPDGVEVIMLESGAKVPGHEHPTHLICVSNHERPTTIGGGYLCTAVARSCANDSGHDGCDDDNDDEENDEADDTLLSCLACRDDGLVGGLKTLAHVVLDSSTVLINDVDLLALLSNKNVDLLKQLSKLDERPLNLLDVLVSLLNFSQRTSGFTMSIRVEQRLGKDLLSLVIFNGCSYFLGCGIRLDNLVLPLCTISVLFAVRLFYLLIPLNRLFEPILLRSNLGPAHILVSALWQAGSLRVQVPNLVLNSIGQATCLSRHASQLLMSLLRGSFVHVVQTP
jgi:hypothetical protein